MQQVQDQLGFNINTPSDKELTKLYGNRPEFILMDDIIEEVVVKEPKISKVAVAVALAISTLALTGCSGLIALEDVARTKWAETTDAIVNTAIHTICTAATQGSVKRRFATEDQQASYDLFCEVNSPPNSTE